MSSTSHYEVFGTMPTLTAEQKESVLNPVAYVLPPAGEETLGGVLLAKNVAESEATTIAGLKESLNALLASLKAAGIMAADEEEAAES